MNGDEQLIDAALAGDLDSFGVLAQRYYSPIVALAYSRLGDHHLAEDAAQEALAKALSSLAKLRRKDRFAFWLGCIVRNTARDIARQQPRRVGLSVVHDPPAGAVRHATTAEHAVRQAIGRLPRADRELVTLRYYDNCSYKQISTLLGLSHAAINGRLSRAKRKIARHLAHAGIREY